MPALKHLSPITTHGYPVFVTTNARRGLAPFSNPQHASMMTEALYAGRASGWFGILAFVVMPNHLHLLLLQETKKLPQIMQGLKGASSRWMNETAGVSGSLWQPGYYDYAVDTEQKAATKRRYLEWNPIRAGLASQPEDSPFSSAHPDRETDWAQYFSGLASPWRR